MNGSNYKNLDKLFQKYNKAVNNRSPQVSISTIELGLILQDITELSVSVTQQNSNNEQLTQAVNMLTEILKNMLDEDNDTSTF